MSARRTCNWMFHPGVRPDVVDIRNIAEGDRGQPVYPLAILGSRKARKGRKATRHLPHLVGILPCEHGRLPEGCQEQWGSSERATSHESSMPAGRVGWGIVVGGQESCPHEDEDSWRRPLACGKTRPEVPSERASCPRGKHCGAGEMGRNASCAHGERPQVLSRIP